jgi:ribose transport system ATP-binding protein
MSGLQMVNISKRFEGVQALSHASLEVQAAEVHALVGENGAGKSTLMKILAGVFPPDEGSILLNGEPIKPRSYREAVQAGISMIFQERSLFGSLTVAENIFIDSLPRNRCGMLKRQDLIERTQELLEQLEFQISPGSQVQTLSVGEQQLVEIAKSVATGVRVIIMDEPTASLTPRETAKLFEIVRRLRKSDVSIVYISHRLDEIMEIADRITVLRDGQVVGTWRSGEISQKEVAHKMVGRTVEGGVRRSASAFDWNKAPSCSRSTIQRCPDNYLRSHSRCGRERFWASRVFGVRGSNF